MSLNPKQFRSLIERVLAEWPELNSERAVNLLLGTAAQESGFGTYLRQVHGPAIGFFQMEPNTFYWLQEVYGEEYKFEGRTPDEMEWDLRLAILLARLRYRTVPESIPETVTAQATYWNENYNCNPKYGTDEEFIKNYTKYVT